LFSGQSQKNWYARRVAKKKQANDPLVVYHAEFQRALHTTHEFLVQLVQAAADRISPEFEEAVWEAEEQLVDSFEGFVRLYGDRVEQLEVSDRKLQERVRLFEDRMKELDRVVQALGPLILDPGSDKIQ
jgi:hypothetical protein